jgi:sortase A
MLARVLRTTGELLITIGVVILLFCGYELYFTGIETAREQRALEQDIRATWRDGGGSYPTVAEPAPEQLPELELGDGVAIIRVPRWSRTHADVIVEGVRLSDLKKGPGHYPESALPGQIGNFVVSGHRTTYGAPFGRMDDLVPGDPVVIETRDMWFTYRVTAKEVVRPTEVEVILPVPRQEGVRPTKALLTLTTCHPKYSARQRLIVYAELAEKTPKAGDTLPPALMAA